MTQKIISLILFSVAFSLLGKAQSNVRLNNYWNNTYYINPGSIESDYKTTLNMAARNQWMRFDGAPITLFARASYFSQKMNTQFGIKAYADQIGYSTYSNVSLSYSYSASLNRTWLMNMGVAGSFQSLTFDGSQVSVLKADDPALYESLLEEFAYNFDTGVEFINKDWRLGLSAQNIFGMFRKSRSLYANTNFAYGIYRPESRKNLIEMQFGICAIHSGKLLQFENSMSAFLEINDDPDAFQMGVFYRTWNEMGVTFGCNLTKGLRISYCYDFNVSGISRYSVGSHELMLSYKIDKFGHRQYRY